MKITRIDNGDGSKSQHDIDVARDKLEGSGYFKAGTIDECVKLYSGDGEGFTLRSPWAHWRFEL